MSRKAEYSLNQVFEAAIALVLAHGYRGCSMDTLISETGFNRRAFYLEFGSKQAFMSALVEYYIDQYLLPMQQAMLHEDDIPQAVVTYFTHYQKHIEQQGCLLVRLIVELGKEDENIQHLARHYYDQLQQTFIACLEKAVAHGQLKESLEIEPLALKLSCFAQGFAISNNIREGQSDALIIIESLFSKRT